jgi:hypothetical protein
MRRVTMPPTLCDRVLPIPGRGSICSAARLLGFAGSFHAAAFGPVRWRPGSQRDVHEGLSCRRRGIPGLVGPAHENPGAIRNRTPLTDN